jgi:hypothetical protein
MVRMLDTSQGLYVPCCWHSYLWRVRVIIYERTTLEGMIQSRDELILEMAEEYGPNRMGENDDDEGEDDDNEGNAVTPPGPAPAAVPDEIVEEEDPIENGPQELDDLNDLGDLDGDPNEGRSDVEEWFPKDGCNDQD